ncbi:MAG: hypothetical protein EA428_02110 [Spirochaetaceae bacterium]|nr:MAG: hypothetical protein EA428_02110 [Spirochaetaceae bacterium]
MVHTLLLSAFDLGHLSLRNRIVMPPMVIWEAGEDGKVTQAHLAHYRASVGAGLCIVEATVVSPEGRLAATQLGAFDNAQVEGLSQLAELIRAGGSVPGIQLHHAGAKTTHKKNYGLPILAPTDIEDSPDGTAALDEDEIFRIVRDFANAAERVADAGFEYIELHGAHGYLGSQFLSPARNRRSDSWGGSLEGRVRFLVEITTAVKARLSARAQPPVLGMRLGVADGEPGGLTLSEGMQAAQMAVAAGVEVLHVSHGGSLPSFTAAESRWSPTLGLAEAVRPLVDVPVIGVGEIRTADEAEDALSLGAADLIAVGRAQLADPGWARKVITHQTDTIEICQDCKPKCFHFSEPSKCPARKNLRKRGEL